MLTAKGFSLHTEIHIQNSLLERFQPRACSAHIAAMAPSLLALPPEIRIRIYGYALYRDVDIALIPYDIGRHAIHDGDFESMAFAATSPDSHLISYQDYPAWPSGRSPAENTALVRTCRLIHEEAIPFMYVGRKFVYYHVNTTNHHPPYYTARSFPKKNLQFVQDLLIIVDPGCINGVTPTEVDSRIADLVAHGCGARHLMLKFDLWFNEPITGDRKRLVSDLAHQTMALQSIASLPRLQDIKVRISEYRGIDLDEVYGPLIAKIEATKDWVREDDNGAYHAHGWGCGCTWVLRRPVKQLSALIGSPVSQQEASEGWGIQGQVGQSFGYGVARHVLI